MFKLVRNMKFLLFIKYFLKANLIYFIFEYVSKKHDKCIFVLKLKRIQKLVRKKDIKIN